MCNLKHPVSGPDPGAIYTGQGPTSADPSQNLGSKLDVSAPPPTSTTMQPTKFAKLLKVVMPIIQGGAVGATSGNWRVPGSGGQEANQFFQQQANRALQQKELALRTQQQASEAQWRQAEAQRAEAQAQGVGKIYEAEDATGERHSFRIRPDGTSEDLGKNPLPDRFTSVNTAGGLAAFDTRHGTMEPIPDLEPEKHGNLPLPGEEEPPQMQAAPKTTAPPRPIAVREGEELVDPTGKVIVPARPKTFAPRAAKGATATEQKKAEQGTAETYADKTLQAFGGDIDKAIAFVSNAKGLDPEMKATVRKLMRDIKKPAPGAGRSKFFEQMMNDPAMKARLRQAPPG